MNIASVAQDGYNILPLSNDGAGLPMTGMDIVVIMVVAFGLLAQGAFIMRLAR